MDRPACQTIRLALPMPWKITRARGPGDVVGQSSVMFAALMISAFRLVSSVR
jgi:hypothetical protein